MTCLRTYLTLLLAAGVVAVGPVSPAAAQFDTPNRQFHNQTSFPLDGRHRDLACESCHRGAVFQGTPARCFDCHWTRRQDDRYRLQLGSQCEQCHRTTSWSDVRWDHGAMTAMPLGVAHRQVTCTSCHANNTFAMAQVACVSCHLPDYQATLMPNHLAAGFPTTCEACHRVSDATFRGGGVNHNAVFPLVGRHAQSTCETCHANNVFRGTPRDCVGCHQSDYNRTTSPNHRAAGFPTSCESCHRNSDSSWAQATFSHRFPITSGPHRTDCVNCHTSSGSFAVFNCLNCHQRAKMDDTHRRRAGYRYESVACYGCHPRGRE